MLHLAARAHCEIVSRIGSVRLLFGWSLKILLATFLCHSNLPSVFAADEPGTFSNRIDEATQAAAIGPLATVCNDTDFLRRIFLDLTGIIPTTEQTKEFLANPSPTKREDLIHRLLESPEFSRHFAVQLNVLLLDRRTDQYVDVKSWESYLIDSLERRKPLDQIYQELIYPDGIAEGITPARKFLLNRGVEPHAVTRDVGRLLFGMDMQCAQCHDHPLIDDYSQADYFGLFAFLSRSSLFVDPKSKVGKLSEKADGESSFESVFTGEGRAITRPRLPKGAVVYVEPRLPEDQAYEVKPEKTQAAKPKYSRREVLAKMLRDSDPFKRNVANRLWGMLMGRGLVHPSDFHSLDNPPINPRLLNLLADELAASNFDLRHLVRQIALSKTYQRSIEPPSPETINLVDIRLRLDAIKVEREAMLTRIAELRTAVTEAQTAWDSKLAVNDKTDAGLLALVKPMADAKKTLETAEAELAKATENHRQMTQKFAAIAGVLTATRAAYEKQADEKPLADAIAILEKRNAELTSLVGKSTTELEKQTATTVTARQASAKLQADAVALEAQRTSAEALIDLERKFLTAQSQHFNADAEIKRLGAQAILCQEILDHSQLQDSDPEKAEGVWAAIVQRWTAQGQVAALKPLTPEQLAASTMRATGFLDRTEASALAAVDKAPPKELSAPDVAEEMKAHVKKVAVQVEFLNQLRGSVNPFVDQFGGLAGEEFQASVNQALFFGNSSTVNNWLAPSTGTLVGKLKEIPTPETIADELSLAVLSRPATIDEQREVQQLLQPAEGKEAPQRDAAIAELVWALITSNEFRFNH